MPPEIVVLATAHYTSKGAGRRVSSRRLFSFSFASAKLINVMDALFDFLPLSRHCMSVDVSSGNYVRASEWSENRVSCIHDRKAVDTVGEREISIGRYTRDKGREVNLN